MSTDAQTPLRADQFQWRVEGGGVETGARCLAFLAEVGIAVRLRDAETSQSIEGLSIRDGAVVIDPEVPIWPGDLLHEAGHVAVVPPETRATMSEVRRILAEERMAIAWSYAAAKQCGVGLRELFHSEGYKGRSEFAAQCYALGRYEGADLLAAQGMTEIDLMRALELGHPTYPNMLRWLR